MSRRVLLAVPIGAALLAWLLWVAIAPADPVAPPVGPAPGTASVERAPLAGEVAAAPAHPTEPVSRTAIPTPDPQRSVRVVDENGAPVGGAEVAFDLALDLIDGWPPSRFDVEERLAAAPRYRSTNDGVAMLPTNAAVAFVIARAGERFGHRAIGFDSPLYAMPELTIAPDRTLHIAVRSPRGEPRSGVPVAVTWQDESTYQANGTRTFELPRTDEKGLTTLWHAQTLWFWDRRAPAIDLRAVVLGATPPIVHVALADAPAEPIVLECPDHGGIVVRSWLAEGIPDPTPVDLRLGADGAAPAACPGLLLPRAAPAEGHVFPVALDRHWRASASGGISELTPGPVHHGDSTAIDVRSGGRAAYTALLLQPDGQPCRDRSVQLTHGGRSEVRSDGGGRILFACPGNDVTVDVPDLRARATLRDLPEVQGAITDLGTIQLRARPLLAAGRVVDAVTGRPVRAYVRAFGLETPGDPPQFASGPAGVDGTFELWGEGMGAIEVATFTTGYQRTTVTATAGARDLVIALQPTRRLRATVLVDRDTAIEDFDVRVRAGEASPHWRTAMIEPGRFHALFELPDGDDLALEVAGGDEMPPLARVPMRDWRAEDGAFAATVDLRGALANVVVAVRGASEGSIYLRARGAGGPWGNVGLTGRFAIAVTIGTVLDAIVRPADGVCVRATLQTGDNTIVVPPSPVARIEVSGLPPGVKRSEVRVQIRRLVRREPLLDTLVADGAQGLGDAIKPWPRTADDLAEYDDDDAWQDLGDGPLLVPLRRRGSYVAVAHVAREERRVPFVDAAAAIEVTTPGETIDVVIRLDPEKVAAARR